MFLIEDILIFDDFGNGDDCHCDSKASTTTKTFQIKETFWSYIASSIISDESFMCYVGAHSWYCTGYMHL